MVVIAITEAKPGVSIETNDGLFQVIDYKHIKMAQQAVVKIKMKNMITGSITERSFRVSERVEKAHIEHKNMQYLYQAQDEFTFMDQDTFEQVTLSKEKIGEAAGYIKEEAVVTIMYYKDQVIGVNIPNSVELKIVETEPGYKGDTVQGAMKLAKLETGISLQVPLFINQGDSVKGDTRTGKYIERV
ncbi:MAG: elongation factor P [bacterium]